MVAERGEAEILLERGGEAGLAQGCAAAGGDVDRARPGRVRQLAAVSVMATIAIGLVVVTRRRAHRTQAGWDFAQLEGAGEAKCSAGYANCNETRCCAGSGLQCYQQGPAYAQCREACAPGPDPTHWNGGSWSCKELGKRTPGEVACGRPGEDCRESKCCMDIGTQCYEKNASWATCKVECVAGAPDLSDEDNSPWTCEELGDRKPGTQPWVQQECSAGWDNCVNSPCCKNVGEICCKQNDYFGACKQDWQCSGPPWSGETAGTKTPGAPVKGGKVAEWVTSECSLPSEPCMESKCCIGMNVQCLQKNDHFAQCRETCTPGADPSDNNETWTCKELGPRSWGLALKGFPSLFCFSLTRTVGYEVGLMKAMLEKGTGIFACDESALLTADGQITLGKGHRAVTSIKFQGAVVGTSKDGTAGNTQLFVDAWDAIVNDGRWRNHSWTVKADPDAVLLPGRLRWHLAAHTGENVFVVNCNKFPGSPNYPMMYGALEVFSYSAMQAWSARGHTCYAPNDWGEDYYMTHCMDFLGVGRILDERVLGDNLCTGANCGDGWPAAFHPFKDIGAWMKCYEQAVNVTPGDR